MGKSRRQNNRNRRKSRKKLGGSFMKSPTPITAKKVEGAYLDTAIQSFNDPSAKTITITIEVGKNMLGDTRTVMGTKQYYRLISITENGDATFYRVKTTKGNQEADEFITTKPNQNWAKKTFIKAKDIRLPSSRITYVVKDNKCYVRFDSNDIYYATINAPSDKKRRPINNANIRKAIAT